MTARRFTLADAPFANRTGVGITVAVVDSGVHPGHPHVGQVGESVCIVPTDGPADTIDRLGHGTAVAAAIREKAPAVELIVAKVFDRALSTNAETLARGLEWAVGRGARIVNLSLGTTNPARAELLRASVEGTRSRAIVVSPRESDGLVWLPGSLAGVAGVAGVVADASFERDELGLETDESGSFLFRASPYPRPIPSVPKERNLSGVSFAVANVSGFLARLLETRTDVRGLEDVIHLLSTGGRSVVS